MKRRKLKVFNVMKVADIARQDMLPETVTYLEEHTNSRYIDQNDLQEHLFGISLLIEDIDHGDAPAPTAEVREELEELDRIMSKKDCAYIRMVRY